MSYFLDIRAQHVRAANTLILFDAPFWQNPLKPNKTYISRNYSPCATLFLLTVYA